MHRHSSLRGITLSVGYHEMNHAFILIPVFILSLSCVSQKPVNAQLDKIFASDKFFITRTQFGGYFPVYDSAAFRNAGAKTVVDFYTISPNEGNSSIRAELSDRQLQEIKQLLLAKSSRRKEKCPQNILTVFSKSESWSLVDTSCEDLIVNRIRQFLREAEETR